MSRATLKWLETHGTGPYRHEMIADICDRLDEGEEMGVDYLYPGTGGPIRVTVRSGLHPKKGGCSMGYFRQSAILFGRMCVKRNGGTVPIPCTNCA